MALNRTDYSRLFSLLSRSNTQKENPALYQTVNGLITASADFQKLILDNFADTPFGVQIQDAIDGIGGAVTIRQIDTSTGPVSRSLETYVNGLTIFKDITGDAGANPITLTGTVDGVVDPQISTNFGVFRVFRNSNGGFSEW